MNLLRFFTAGSIDDGKSTLIGRLLYDSSSLLNDQINAISEENKINLALVTDGLKAEREQGITIDVAYRYFSTEKRKFIIADCPGHVEYTRNMITACSSSYFAILLVDARNGITEQTKRHAYISSLMGIKKIAICINKMDLVDYSEEVFEKIQKDFSPFLSQLSFKETNYIPISALNGDNIVTPSEKITWYNGGTLLHLLETVEIEISHLPSRFNVQTILRPYKEEFHDFRGIAGFLNSGSLKKEDSVTVLPQGQECKVLKILDGSEELTSLSAKRSATLILDKEIDISRGDMIAQHDQLPKANKVFEAIICFMSKDTLTQGKKYILQHHSNSVKVLVNKVFHKINIHSFEEEQANTLGLNDIGKVSFKSSKEIFYDSYSENRYNGNFILVDEATNNTVAGGIIIN